MQLLQKGEKKQVQIFYYLVHIVNKLIVLVSPKVNEYIHQNAAQPKKVIK